MTGLEVFYVDHWVSPMDELLFPVIVANAKSLKKLYMDRELPEPGDGVKYERLQTLQCYSLSSDARQSLCPVLVDLIETNDWDDSSVSGGGHDRDFYDDLGLNDPDFDDDCDDFDDVDEVGDDFYG